MSREHREKFKADYSLFGSHWTFKKYFLKKKKLHKIYIFREIMTKIKDKRDREIVRDELCSSIYIH